MSTASRHAKVHVKFVEEIMAKGEIPCRYGRQSEPRLYCTEKMKLFDGVILRYFSYKTRLTSWPIPAWRSRWLRHPAPAVVSLLLHAASFCGNPCRSILSTWSGKPLLSKVFLLTPKPARALAAGMAVITVTVRLLPVGLLVYFACLLTVKALSFEIHCFFLLHVALLNIGSPIDLKLVDNIACSPLASLRYPHSLAMLDLLIDNPPFRKVSYTGEHPAETLSCWIAGIHLVSDVK